MSHNIPKIHRFHLYNGNQLLVQMRYLAQSATHTHTHVTQIQLELLATVDWCDRVSVQNPNQIILLEGQSYRSDLHAYGTHCSPREDVGKMKGDVGWG